MNAAEQALADLLEWNARMGGWDGPVWDRARAIVDAARNAGDQAHPVPWSIQGLGDTSALLDGADKIVLEVPWDGKQNGDGGVNDALLSIAGTVNGLADALKATEPHLMGLCSIYRKHRQNLSEGACLRTLENVRTAIAEAEGRAHD